MEKYIVIIKEIYIVVIGYLIFSFELLQNEKYIKNQSFIYKIFIIILKLTLFLIMLFILIYYIQSILVLQ